MNFILSIALLMSPLALAEKTSPHKHDHNNSEPRTEQQAHLHGITDLTLALEGNTLEINLESPAINIVGFEYKASTQKQIDAVEKAKSILESSPRLFVFSGSSCTLQQVKADLSALVEGENHDDDHGQEKNHREISANYRFECSQGKKLNAVSVNLIPHFPNIESIKAMWLTDSRQGATVLTAESNLIRIR
jgi:hypothetical protein